MKFAQALVAALVGGFVLNLAVSAHAQSTKQYATIVRIQGEARYTTGDNMWHPLTVGQTLGPGDTIWVPKKPERKVWKTTLETIAVVSQLATVYVVITNAVTH